MDRKPTSGADWRRLLGRLKRVAGTADDAEDLLQSAFLRLISYRHTAEVEKPEAFLVRTAINLGIDERRKLRHRLEIGGLDLEALEIADQAPPADEVFDARTRLEGVKIALQQLPPRTLEIFLLRRVDGLRHREIANRLGITVSAVEKHVARAALHVAQWAKTNND